MKNNYEEAIQDLKKRKSNLEREIQLFISGKLKEFGANTGMQVRDVDVIMVDTTNMQSSGREWQVGAVYLKIEL